MRIQKTNAGYEVIRNNQTICTFEKYEDAKKALDFLREKTRA